MSNGQQPAPELSESQIILFGVVFSWVVLGMLYVSLWTVGDAPAKSNFDFAFYLVYAGALALSVYGAHVTSHAWVLGVGRFNLDFAAYSVASMSFAVLAGVALSHAGIFPVVINVPAFFAVSVIFLVLHWSAERRQKVVR